MRISDSPPPRYVNATPVKVGLVDAQKISPIIYTGEGEGGESSDERDEAAPGGDEQEEDARQGAHQ